MKRVRQSDFSLGMFAVEAQEAIPAGGVELLENMLIEDSGGLRRRGGCVAVTSADAALVDTPLTMWDGVLAGGRTTVFGGPDGLWWNNAGVPAIAATQLGAGPFTIEMLTPTRPVGIAGMVLFPFNFPSGANVFAAFGGSRSSVASYSVGSVTMTAGSRSVTGAGTSWLANAAPGMIFAISPATSYGVVESVQSNTALTLVEPWDGAAGVGLNYSVHRCLSVGGPAALDVSKASQLAVVAGRLVIGAGRDVFFSSGPDPATGGLRPFQWPVNNRHKLPEGAEVTALAHLRDRLFVFSTAGVYVISGLAQEIVAPDGTAQHRVDLVSRDVVALKNGAGITTWRDALVVPATDDVYLIDGLSAPMPVSGSARKAYRAWIEAGGYPGGATIFRGHHVMPMLTTGAVPSEVWLFRLDRPAEVRGLGVVFPWSKWKDQAGELGAVVTQQGAAPLLLGAGQDATPRARLLDLAACFDDETEDDQDGADVVGRITFRSLAGAGLRSMWRTLRLRYEAVGWVGGDPVTFTAAADGGAAQSVAGSFAAQAAQAWRAFSITRMGEFLRVVLTVGGGSRFVVREVEAEFEEPGR